MDGEEEAAEPGLAQAEAGEQPPDEQGVEGVQRDGDEVIAERVVAEEVPLDPEESFLDRVVFDPTAGREPEFPEAVEVAHERLVGDVPVVVPEPVAVDGGRVDPQDGEDDGDDAEPAWEIPAQDFARGCGSRLGRGGGRSGLPFRALGHVVIRLTGSYRKCDAISWPRAPIRMATAAGALPKKEAIAPFSVAKWHAAC